MEKTCKELKAEAKLLGIPRFSQMRKRELIQAINLYEKKDFLSKQSTKHQNRKVIHVNGQGKTNYKNIEEFLEDSLQTFDPEFKPSMIRVKQNAKDFFQK